MKKAESRLLDRITDAFVALDADWRFVFVSRQAAELLERDRHALVDKDIWAEFPALVGEPLWVACRQAMARQVSTQSECHLAKLGCWIENRIYPSPEGLTIFFMDITERKSQEARLRRSQDIFRPAEVGPVTGSFQAGFLIEDGIGRIALTNQALCDMLGVAAPPGTLVGARIALFAPHIRSLFREPDRLLAWLAEIHSGRRPLQGEELPLADGRMFELNYSPMFLAHGGGHLWQLRDVTKRQRITQQFREASSLWEVQKQKMEAQKQALEEVNTQLQILATTDNLTGLLNHRMFEQKLSEEFVRARRYGEPLSLIVLDVDQFKAYNDVFGHLAGNAVLKVLARILQEHIRGTDLAARFGGEEFTLILPHTEVGEAVTLAERLRAAIENTDWGNLHGVTVSFGVCALAPDASGPDVLFACADAALYRAKVGGRNQVAIG